MSERIVLRNELCIAGEDLENGDFVKFSDGGRWYRADKCTEADADGVCTAARKKYQMVEVDVFQPWTYTAGYDENSDTGEAVVVIVQNPGNRLVARYAFTARVDETRQTIINALAKQWSVDVVVREANALKKPMF